MPGRELPPGVRLASWGRRAGALPPGGGVGLGRLLLRIVLGNVSLGVYTVLTYLWPLWDEKNQTLDDKIVKTIVIRV